MRISENKVCHYKSIPCGDYKGYAMYFLTNSYNCPALKLYGYSTDLVLVRAINRKLKAIERKHATLISK